MNNVTPINPNATQTQAPSVQEQARNQLLDLDDAMHFIRDARSHVDDVWLALEDSCLDEPQYGRACNRDAGRSSIHALCHRLRVAELSIATYCGRARSGVGVVSRREIVDMINGIRPLVDELWAAVEELGTELGWLLDQLAAGDTASAREFAATFDRPLIEGHLTRGRKAVHQILQHVLCAAQMLAESPAVPE